MENKVQEVSAEVIHGIVDRYVDGKPRKEDRGAFIAKVGDIWEAVDNIDGDCFVEEFKTKAEALAYAKGEIDVV